MPSGLTLEPTGPERSFLRACLAHCLYPERPLPATPPDLDWDRVYRLVCQGRLPGLFYSLGQAHAGPWPKALQERLAGARYRALLHGDWCASQVQRILSALNEARIPVIVLKGWALIPTLYGGDPSQRTYDDIDLLVLPQQAPRAEGILHELGYRGLLADPWPGYRWRYHNSWAYRLPEESAPSAQVFSVGLHWGLLDTPFYSRRMPVQELLERAQPVTVADIEVRRLAAEDGLVYACGHLALHHEYDEALFRTYEMASLILRADPALDWKAVLERACTWRLTIPTKRVLTHLEELWPGLVPSRVLDQMRTLQPTRAERLVHRLVVENRENHSIRAMVSWLTMPGLSNRIRYILETAFPSAAYMRQRYGPAPGGLWPLLYLRRVGAAIRFITP